MSRPKPLRILGIGFLALLVVFFAIWLLGRTGLGNPYPREQITLRLWTVEENEDALRALVSRYEQRHKNVHIELSAQAPANYASALDAAAKAGASPDLYLVSPDQILRNPANFTSAPRRLIKADRIRRDFIPAVSETLIRGDALYGLPLSVDNLALYYRKSLLKEAGVKPPATWSELLQIVGKLSSKNGLSINRAAVSLGTPLTDPGMNLLQVLMAQNGVSLQELDTWTAADRTGYYPGVKALDFFTSFANPQKSSYTWSDSLGSPPDAFVAGRTAMLIGPASLRSSLAPVGSDLGLSPLPAIRSDRPLNQASFSAYAVSSSSPNVYVAWDFLKFSTGERELSRYLDSSERLSPRLDLARSQSRDGKRDAFASQLSVSHSWPLSAYPETAQALQAAVASVLTGRQTSLQALEQAVATLQPLLK